MKTVPEIISWLNTSQHIKCILADISEVGNSVKTTFNFSSTAYYDSGVLYDACITGGLSFTESLSVEGTPSLGFGSLDIVNIGGINDSFLEYVWNKRSIKIYLGDPSWPKSDFVLIFDGLVQDITAPSETTLSFSLFDKLQRLNDPITEKTLKSTSYSQNTQDNVLPLLFGECFNISPLLVDNGSTQSGGQVYMVHDGPIQGIIEVRDNGIPIAVEPDLATGTFELLTAPYGTITCSAQGSAGPYSNTIPDIIKKIVTTYGTVENKFLAADVSFEDITNTSPVGVYSNDRRNILEACTELAKSINANLVCPSVTVDNGVVSNSKLKLIEIKPPTGTPKYYLNDSNMLLNSLSISERFAVKPSIKLGYCKNYTVQNTVADGVNPTSKFEDEYIFVTSINGTKRALYRDSGDVTEESVLLISTSAAQSESDKRLALWEEQRYIISASYLPHLIFVQLGDIVNIQSSRFGLSAGKLGMVYSVTRNWVTGQVDIGVLV